MTVLLLLGMFLTFILIDCIQHKNKKQVLTPISPTLTNYVGGFIVPQNVNYHPGHSWVSNPVNGVVEIGIDSFAQVLLSGSEEILPSIGTKINQGEPIFTFIKNEEKVNIVSPISGEVIEINDTIKVKIDDEKNQFRNLIPANLTHIWFENALEKLYSFQPQLAGETAYDGGKPITDISSVLTNVTLTQLAGEFFLA